MSKKRIAVLGSTGSIGTQTLDIVRNYNNLFEITSLSANNNWELLVKQAREFDPDNVVIANTDLYPKVKEALADTYIKVYAGAEALEQVVAQDSVDIVVSALVGFAGLYPTVSAIKKGKKIALANKETLVAGGDIVMKLAEEYRAPIIPVDSEHSAIFQCLVGERSDVEKLILTASGGPFVNFDAKAFAEVTVEQALCHPNWSMGRKITIDSATMMNKGFEVIEARHLFNIPVDKIDVLVHPSSVVHSMVQFSDGAVKAQLGTADMRLPIQYALTFPERLAMSNNHLSFAGGVTLEFREPNKELFPCLEMAYEAIRKGGSTPAVLNAANEVAVSAFLKGEIRFVDIASLINSCLDSVNSLPSPSLEDIRDVDAETRKKATQLLKKFNI